jgi:hypothetical protein
MNVISVKSKYLESTQRSNIDTINYQDIDSVNTKSVLHENEWSISTLPSDKQILHFHSASISSNGKSSLAECSIPYSTKSQTLSTQKK